MAKHYCTACQQNVQPKSRGLFFLLFWPWTLLFMKLRCPMCGLPVTTKGNSQSTQQNLEKKPLLKRWWIWIAGIVVIGAVVGSIQDKADTELAIKNGFSSSTEMAEAKSFGIENSSDWESQKEQLRKDKAESDRLAAEAKAQQEEAEKEQKFREREAKEAAEKEERRQKIINEFRSYAKVGEVVSDGRVEGKVISYYATPNALSMLHEPAGPGMTYLVVKSTVKNISDEPRSVMVGNVRAFYNNSVLDYETAEVSFADGFLAPFDSINPLTSTSGMSAFKLPIEVVKGGLLAFELPGVKSSAKYRVFLSND